MKEIPEGTLAENIEDCKKCRKYINNQCEEFGVIIDEKFTCGAFEVRKNESLGNFL